MPPQRRKIVPPNTTAKARKKVAGSNRKPDINPEAADAPTDIAGSLGTGQDAESKPAVETKQDAESKLTVESEPSEETSASDATKSDTTKSDSVVADSAVPDSVGEQSAPSLKKKMKTEPETDLSSSDALSRAGWAPSIVVGVLAVLLIAFAVVAAIAPGTSVDNQAWVDQGVTSEVTRSASDGLTALYRYSYETIDDDLAAARSFMGPEMQEQTDKFLEAIKSNAQQSKTSTDVDVMNIGVIRLESDKAELLATLNVSSMRSGVAYGNAMFPLVVNMERVDGKWVVSSTQDM